MRVACAARLFFLIQPIRSLFCGALVVVVFASFPGLFSAEKRMGALLGGEKPWERGWSLLKLPSDTAAPQLESSSGSARLAFTSGRGWRGRDTANWVCCFCWLMGVTDCRCHLLLLFRLPTLLSFALDNTRHLATAHQVQIAKYWENQSAH